MNDELKLAREQLSMAAAELRRADDALTETLRVAWGQSQDKERALDAHRACADRVRALEGAEG